jgi:hypothetical protein
MRTRSHEPDAQTPVWCGSLYLTGTGRSRQACTVTRAPSRPALHWHSGWEPASAHETALSHRIAINLKPTEYPAQPHPRRQGPGSRRQSDGEPPWACRAAGRSRTRAGCRARSESRRHCTRGPGVLWLEPDSGAFVRRRLLCLVNVQVAGEGPRSNGNSDSLTRAGKL